MGYNLNFDEIRNLQSSLMSSVCGWQDLYSQIGAELTGFTGTMGYTGAGGTAIRNYVQEVHGVVCQCLSLLLAEYTGRLLLFGEGLYEYDSDKHACLNEDALAAVGERLEHVAEDLAGLHETARREMQKITDQVDTTCHSGVEEYVTALYNKRTELREYRERIGEYDHTSAAGLEEMKELVSTLRGLADRLYEGGEIRAEAWEPGSFLTGEELEHLAGLVMNSGRFLAENGEAVSAAYEHYTQVWEEIIEELSEERVKQGALLVLASALAIAGVILSAGTLAPEITATLGIAVAAYNSSNLLEGAQDIYYGLNGDPYTLAYNPMCETLFQGNREAYDLFGLTVNSAYAVVVPLNQFACATSTTGQVMVLVDVGAGAVTDYGVTRICEAAGADDMTTFIMGFGAGMLTGMAVDSLNPSVPRRPGSMEMDSGEFHTTIRELQRKGYLREAEYLEIDIQNPAVEEIRTFTSMDRIRADENLSSFETSFMQAVEKENLSLTEYIELVRRPVSQLTEADINKIYRIGCSVADPGNDVLMSKVISEDTYENYIANGTFSDTIGNSVTRAQDMQDCYTFEDYFNKLGLNYDDNPFAEADKLYVVRYTSPDTETLVTRSYGGNTEADVVRMQETLGLDEQHTFMNAEPYLGTGVTRDVEGGIGKLELMTARNLEGRPLFCKIDDGAAIYEVDRVSQVERIVAVRDKNKWRRIRYDEH